MYDIIKLCTTFYKLVSIPMNYINISYIFTAFDISSNIFEKIPKDTDVNQTKDAGGIECTGLFHIL